VLQQLTDPGRVGHVGLAPRHVAQVAGVEDPALEPTRHVVERASSRRRWTPCPPGSRGGQPVPQRQRAAVVVPNVRVRCAGGPPRPGTRTVATTVSLVHVQSAAPLHDCVHPTPPDRHTGQRAGRGAVRVKSLGFALEAAVPGSLTAPASHWFNGPPAPRPGDVADTCTQISSFRVARTRPDHWLGQKPQQSHPASPRHNPSQPQRPSATNHHEGRDPKRKTSGQCDQSSRAGGLNPRPSDPQPTRYQAAPRPVPMNPTSGAAPTRSARRRGQRCGGSATTFRRPGLESSRAHATAKLRGTPDRGGRGVDARRLCWDPGGSSAIGSVGRWDPQPTDERHSPTTARRPTATTSHSPMSSQDRQQTKSTSRATTASKGSHAIQGSADRPSRHRQKRISVCGRLRSGPGGVYSAGTINPPEPTGCAPPRVSPGVMPQTAARARSGVAQRPQPPVLARLAGTPVFCC